MASAVLLGVIVTCLFTPGPGIEGSAHTPDEAPLHMPHALHPQTGEPPGAIGCSVIAHVADLVFFHLFEETFFSHLYLEMEYILS